VGLVRALGRVVSRAETGYNGVLTGGRHGIMWEGAEMALLSAFADEISQDFDEQLAVLVETGVTHVELRGVWGKNVLKLEPREIRDVRAAADAEGIGFSAIGSPLGKFPLAGEFNEQLEGVRRALEYAQILEAPYIRLFSYHIPKGDDAADHRAQVMDWLGQLSAEAEKTDVVLAHENESGIYGDTGARCLDLIETLGSDSFTTIFDFSNYAVGGEDLLANWESLKDHTSYFHIKDFDCEARKVVPAGDGDGHLEPILRDAYARGFDGFLSLEPHLKDEYGATGAERFRAAVGGLNRVLAAIA